VYLVTQYIKRNREVIVKDSIQWFFYLLWIYFQMD